MWVVLPILGVIQVTVLIVAWTRRLHRVYDAFSLRCRDARARRYLLLGAVLLPVLALLGFEEGARAVVRHLPDPAWRAEYLSPAQDGTPAETAWLFGLRNEFLIFYAGLILLALAARRARSWHETGRRGVEVRYPDGRSVRLPRGLSLLDASRKLGVPHASVCGGRGRCSTCRVRRCSRTSAPFHRRGRRNVRCLPASAPTRWRSALPAIPCRTPTSRSCR